MIIEKNKYETYLNYLDSISHLVGDLDMRDGKITQLLNGKIGILDVDLKDLFPEPLSMRFTALKMKLPLFQLFSKVSDSVTVTTADNTIKVNDDFSNISITQAAAEYIGNGYLAASDLAGKLVIDQTTDKIMSCELSKIILDRLSVISSNFQTMFVIFDIKQGLTSIQLVSADKTNKSTIMQGLNTLSTSNQQILFSVFPFQTKFDNEVMLDLYYKQIDSNTGFSIIKLKTMLKGIDTTFWCRGTLVT